MCVYQGKSITVGQLKAALVGIKDDVDVVIELPDSKAGSCNYDGSPGFMAHAKQASFVRASSINNEEFCIECGDTFSY